MNQAIFFLVAKSCYSKNGEFAFYKIVWYFRFALLKKISGKKESIGRCVMKRILMATLVVLIFTFGEGPIKARVDDLDLTARWWAINEWVKGLEVLANRSNDKRVIHALEYFQKNAVLARITRKTEQELLLDLLDPLADLKRKSKTVFYVVPLSTAKGFAAVTQEISAIALFDHNRRVMYLPNHFSLGKLARGLTLFHETIHAIQQRPGLEYICRNEYDAWRIEIEVFKKIGGLAYSTLLKEYVTKQYRSAKTRKGFVVSNYDPRLELIFGKMTSNEEKAVYTVHLEIAALIQVLDLLNEEKFLKPGQNTKLEIFCHYHKMLGGMDSNSK